jgi:hypothetical protein
LPDGVKRGEMARPAWPNCLKGKALALQGVYVEHRRLHALEETELYADKVRVVGTRFVGGDDLSSELH